MSDTITFTILYTILIFLVSGYYYYRGKMSGIKDVLCILKEEEPELSKSFIKKIERKLDVEVLE